MLLEVRNLSKSFGSLVVLDDLSFELEEGVAFGIVGPNGAGKTTLLNVVAGDIRPTRGTVALDGRDVTRLASHRRCRLGIGRTSQVPRPFEGLTVFENVLVGANHGAAGRLTTTPEHAAMAALERVGLLLKSNVPAAQLTLLERKRLELARTLAMQPRLLLLDEIAGGLTEAEVHELVTTIKEIRASGVTIVWIEHIVHALLRVVDRILAIDYGRKLVEGEPDAVMNSPEVREIYLGAEL